jgi:putative exporter of polyketide antibiotics
VVPSSLPLSFSLISCFHSAPPTNSFVPDTHKEEKGGVKSFHHTHLSFSRSHPLSPCFSALLSKGKRCSFFAVTRRRCTLSSLL